MTENDESAAQIEIDKKNLDVLHELVLRGLRQTHPADREYGEAYDAFADSADYPMRIGDQPDRVRDTWDEIVGGSNSDESEEAMHCPKCGIPVNGAYALLGHIYSNHWILDDDELPEGHDAY